MEDYIEISTLNDFIFCPYSIYLHNVYKNTVEDLYYAAPQLLGKYSHHTVDEGTSVRSKGDLAGMSVFSEKYGLMGKIDIYRASGAQLIERKRHISTIYQGQIFQLWAQMLCMREMGYQVDALFFYDISTRKMKPIKTPGSTELKYFEMFLAKYRSFDPDKDFFSVNESKCLHCIYCNLCDKTAQDNVYTEGY
ncbi:MAG: type V CRISPR-associated protein Cas4 [Bacteroidia bacterium]|nr:type V CRISPR-associated protein Cas4 [Bacteroidia bacterium]